MRIMLLIFVLMLAGCGYGPIGPVVALLSLLAVASDHYPIGEEIISESDAAFYRAMMRAGIIRRIS
jgi:hypothetical protein